MSCPNCNEKTLRPLSYEEGEHFAWKGEYNEIVCTECGYRECHKCHKELKGNEKASTFCKGGVHPRIYNI